MSGIFNELKIDSDELVLHMLRNTDLLQRFTQDCVKHNSPSTFLHFLDFAQEYINNEATIEDEDTATGSDGDFSVCTRGYMGIFFVQASEFDDMGYFLSVDDANFAAFDITSNYTSEDD